MAFSSLGMYAPVARSITAGLTVCVDVPQLIVHVEEAPDALFSCGHRPVTRQDIFVELKVSRSLCKVQEPRSFVKHHHDFLQPVPSHLASSPFRS